MLDFVCVHMHIRAISYSVLHPVTGSYAWFSFAVIATIPQSIRNFSYRFLYSSWSIFAPGFHIK